MSISSTTWSLLAYSKTEFGEFDWKSIRSNVLGELYHQDMTLESVIIVLYGAIEEVQKEPKFELHYGENFMRQVLLAPLKFSIFEKPIGELKLEEVYNKMIAEIMYGMRFTRVDWCKETLDKYK